MEPDPTDLEAARSLDEVSAQRKAKAREREVADFKWLMNDPRGRRFVWRLMTQAHVFRDTDAASVIELARAAGQRRQGLIVLDEVIKLCPEHWLTMVKDQAQDERPAAAA